MIDKDQVKHIASLARLKVSDDEIGKLSKDLSVVLDYVKELNKVDVSDVSPTLNASSSENVFRDDDEPDKQDAELAKKLIDSAPENEDGYIKVKSIL